MPHIKHFAPPPPSAYRAVASMDYASTLPRDLLVKIFSGLMYPNPNRVRDLCTSASVCPTWRKAAKEPNLWRVLCVTKAPLNARLTGPRSLTKHTHLAGAGWLLAGNGRVAGTVATAAALPDLRFCHELYPSHAPRPGLCSVRC